MRPDQHKQKKNTQYKKKHGMTEKNKDGKDKKDGKPEGSKQPYRSDASKGEQTKSTNKFNNRGNLSDSSESSDDNDGTATTTSSFQRRKLVSNWDRYELPPDEEATMLSRGDNFSKLLQSAGSSTSQFRFKEEEEDWVESNQSDTLSLDLQDLSSSLGCVPLYKVLRLNKDLFTAEQIEEFDRRSTENQRKYTEKLGNKFSNLVSCSADKKTIENSIVKKTGRRSNESLTLESNALDELLDYVVLDPSTDVNKQSVPKNPESETVSSLENDLDDLLSSGEQEKNKPIVKQKTIESNKKSTADTQENDLEDWLDSVLDS
ncbi:cell death regulator Aven-like [Mytilus trossulus]|uniref:cell death regulator Aven-like n=1 Tax=Mytilus trossulus TaxID=6551 RepID=UPI0030076C4E